MNSDLEPKDIYDEVGYVSSLLLKGLEMLPKALEDIDRAVMEGNLSLEDHVYSKSIWSNIGNILVLNGMLRQARLVYTKMLETIEKYEEKTGRRIYRGLPYYNLGLINFQLTRLSEGSYEKARRYLNEAYEEDKLSFGSKEAESSAAKKTLLHLEEHSHEGTNHR